MLEALQQLQELPPEVLHEKCQRVNSRRALADWQLAACLLACERTQLFRRHECSSVVHYAGRFLNLDPQKASQLLLAATFLEHLPALSEAFRTGQVGWGKVRELKSVMTPETEQSWLAFALSHTVAELQRAVAMNSTEARRRAQAATLASARPAARDGGDLFAPSDKAAPAQAPRSATSPGRPNPNSPTPTESAPKPAPAAPATIPGPAAIPAEGGNEPMRAALPLPPSPPQLVRVTLLFTPEEFVVFQEAEKHARKLLQTRRPRREAAVTEMARRSLAAASARTRARHTVIVHLNAETDTAWFETERGTLPVSSEELAEALTTGTVTFAGETQAPESRTTTERIPRGKRKRPAIPVHILRQLYARAGGCCEVPGCSNRQHLHVHHRRPWSQGGTHELDCLELRCSACHRLAHEEDYRDDPQWDRARARRNREWGSRSAPGLPGAARGPSKGS